MNEIRACYIDHEIEIEIQDVELQIFYKKMVSNYTLIEFLSNKSSVSNSYSTIQFLFNSYPCNVLHINESSCRLYLT